jgi:putative FmdB family regulatory protein
MPIFEYKCKQCNTKFEILHKSSLNQEEVSCPKCNSKENKKLLSSFSATGFSSSSSSCESGSCGIESSYSGGCSTGMCGLN